jgi:Tol biopolymer transport system component
MTQITDFSGFTFADQCMNPVLSPNGNKILFEIESLISGYREIWVVNAVPDSTATQVVADGSNYVIHPSWGPDSDTFAYVHCAGGALLNGIIKKDSISALGSPASLKTPPAGGSCWRPRFNFDGSKIAYVMTKTVGPHDLRVMNDDGSSDAAIDSTLAGYRSNQPSQFSWANGLNKIAFETGAGGSTPAYVVNSDGTGKTQINTSGDAAGAAARLSHLAWPADDSWVLFVADLGFGHISMIRAELDGSDTTRLGTTGAINQGWYVTGLVFENRIWFISGANSVNTGKMRSMALDGTDEVENFNNTLGTGNAVADFTGGDGFYFN